MTHAARVFHLWEPVSLLSGIAALPIALRELSLGVWLVTKGSKPAPITTAMVEERPAH
jgi:hypothetical protein